MILRCQPLVMILASNHGRFIVINRRGHWVSSWEHKTDQCWRYQQEKPWWTMNHPLSTIIEPYNGPNVTLGINNRPAYESWWTPLSTIGNHLRTVSLLIVCSNHQQLWTTLVTAINHYRWILTTNQWLAVDNEWSHMGLPMVCPSKMKCISTLIFLSGWWYPLWIPALVGYCQVLGQCPKLPHFTLRCLTPACHAQLLKSKHQQIILWCVHWCTNRNGTPPLFILQACVFHVVM